MKLLIALLLTIFCFTQTEYYDVYISDCANNTVIRKNTVIKKLVFKSNMLPMSYNTKLKLGMVEGTGVIVSPSSLTDRRPKEGESEPIVILTLPIEYYQNLSFGEFVTVIYE